MRRLIVIVVSILIALLALEFHAQTAPAQTQKPPQTQAPQTPPAQTQKPPQTQAPQTPPAQTQKPAQTPPPAQAPAPTQAPPAAAKPPAPEPLQLAEDWLARLNSLDDWTLTFEGKEVGR